MALGALGGAFLGQAAGGLLGGLFGGDGQDAANRANALLMQQIQNQFRELGARRELAFRDAQIAKERLLDDVMGDLDRAEARVGGGGRQAQRDVVARGEQTQAAVDQNLVSRGLNASTISANAQRGIASDTSRNLAGIDAMVNQQLAGLSGQRAGFRSALGGDLSELPIRDLGFATQHGMGLAQLMSGFQHTAQPGNGAGIGGALGGLAGFALGGGFGGFGGGGTAMSGLADPGLGGLGGWFA